MQIPVIMDCDPGHDDAVALFIALASEKIKVLGITTSAGNQLPEKTFKNARKLLALAQREDITVCSGAKKPLSRELIIADKIHGETGLDGAELPNPSTLPNNKKAWEFMAGLLKTSKEPVNIVATGPLTNVAILLLSYPELKPLIKSITIMGGACFGGNITPAAEFNIYVDPEAADIVFKSGIPINMFGLDVTLKAQMLPDEIEQLADLGNTTGKIFSDLLKFFIKSATPYFLAGEGHVEGVHLHDACTIAYLIEPSIFRMHDCFVEVDTNDGPTLGSTIVDYNRATDRSFNTSVAFEIDRKKFVHMVSESLKQFR